MTRTAVLLLIPFLLFLIGYCTIARNEARATVQVKKRGSNGTRPKSVQSRALASVVPSSMTGTVGLSFKSADRSLPTERSTPPEIFLRTLTARSNTQHWPQPPEDDRQVPVTETSQAHQDAVSHGFTLSQDVKERLLALETSTLETNEPLRSFTFSDWLRSPCCRPS